MSEQAPRGADARLQAPITLDQLRVFLEVVDAGSFSNAARRLRRVQSAISYAIANLERLLEAQLFERNGRAPRLSEAGRRLLPDARAVLGRADALFERARGVRETRALRVAASPGAAAARVLRALSEDAGDTETLELTLLVRGGASALLDAGEAELLVESADSAAALGVHRVELPEGLAASHHGALSAPGQRLLERLSG